jgi:tetratricopeptide (TPR) repeat protein
MDTQDPVRGVPNPESHLRKKRQLEDCFARALHLFKHDRNYDYAHTLLMECVAQDPGNVGYTEAFLENLSKRSGDKRKSFFRRGSPAASNAKKAAAAQQWTETLRSGLDALSSNPWHVPTLQLMAEACAQLHLPQVELVYLKQALDAEPKNREVNRHCARSLARMGQFDQAIACWHRIETICGKDAEASTMISQLAEKKLLHLSGRTDESAPVPITAAITGEERIPTPSHAGQSLEARLSPRQSLEQAIQQDPADVENYFMLAELLCNMGQLDLAEAILARARTNCAQTSAIDQRLEGVQRRRAELVLAAANEERSKQLRAARQALRFPWLEVSLVGAGAALILQLVPSWQAGLTSFLVDHLQAVLLAANAMLVLGLILFWQWGRR